MEPAILRLMHTSHTHICFQPRWTLDGPTQNLLGQCHAFIVAMLGTPIRPDYRQELLLVALARGAQATTAIEGNTLSDAEVDAVQAGKSLLASKEYLEKEVKNILIAFNLILNELIRDKSEELISPNLIRRFHRLVGEGLGDAFAAEPGSFRRKNVVVGNYRPPLSRKCLLSSITCAPGSTGNSISVRDNPSRTR